ncbi:MAG: membrane protein insertase YidC [Armatimonadetes bacterium]|nr:membrane protein insertase YidC [Armatimonadota bacterium]
MSQQPTRKSNFLQMMLIFAVVYLGYMLFFGSKQAEQAPVGDVEKTYTDAAKKNDGKKVLELGPAYVKQLRKDGSGASLQKAREVELAVGVEIQKEAAKTQNFNQAVLAHTQFEKIYTEAPDSAIGARGKAEMAKTSEIGKKIGSQTIGYRFVDFIVNLFGGERAPGFSYWFAALFLAIIVRALVWPLARKQMIGFKRMALLQPMIKELQAKYQGPELQQRTMKLYQRYGINPLASCLPMLVQMPFFLWVFWGMSHYRFDFHKGTFLWINEQAAASFPGIFAPNLGERDVPLVVLYGLSMIATTMLSVSDPQTAKQSRIIGIVTGVFFTILFLTVLRFPSAFILYWIGLNILSTIQSVMINRSPIPPLVERPDGGKGGMFAGMIPKDGPTANVNNGAPKLEQKTGAPVLHKPKSGKQQKRKKR